MAAQFDARLSADLAIKNVSGRRVAGRHQRPLRPQSSSASRLTAGASGFFILSQSGERPERVGRALALRDDAFQPDGARRDTLAVPTVPPIAASGSRDLARPRPVPKHVGWMVELMVYGRPGDPNGKALDFVEAAEIAGMKRDVAHRWLDRGEVRALLRLLGSVDTGNDFSTGAFCEMASNGVGDCDE
jgi:hypothetical protein